jgi:hypothetical protein
MSLVRVRARARSLGDYHFLTPKCSCLDEQCVRHIGPRRCPKEEKTR